VQKWNKRLPSSQILFYFSLVLLDAKKEINPMDRLLGEKFRLLRNEEVHHRVQHKPTRGTHPVQIKAVNTIPLDSLRFISNLSSCLILRLPSGLFPSGCPTKILYALVILQF
jgi:hypothetical protein